MHRAGRGREEVPDQHPSAVHPLATAAWGASDGVHRDVLSAGLLSVRQGVAAEKLVDLGPGARAWVEAQLGETLLPLLLRQPKETAHF